MDHVASAAGRADRAACGVDGFVVLGFGRRVEVGRALQPVIRELDRIVGLFRRPERLGDRERGLECGRVPFDRRVILHGDVAAQSRVRGGIVLHRRLILWRRLLVRHHGESDHRCRAHREDLQFSAHTPS